MASNDHSSAHVSAPAHTPETDLAFAKRWALTWIGIGLWGVIAVLALFGAADASTNGTYICALLAALGSILMVLANVKRYLDGYAPRILPDVLVSRFESLMLLIPVMAVFGVAGLFLAAGSHSGGVYTAGLGMFVAACLTIFLSVKNCFDRAEHRDVVSEHSVGPRDPLDSKTL